MLDPVVRTLAEARGTTLAAELRAAVPLPPFDTSAMDGYAVAGPGPWRLVGRVLAGEGRSRALSTGEALEVATGAPVPSGAEAVLPYEQAKVTGTPDQSVRGDSEPGRHIRRRGEECAPGTVLLEPGTPVTPLVLGLAASVGIDHLTVRPRPRVAAVVTGDELLRSGVPGAGQVRDAIGPTLRGLVSWFGGDLVEMVHVGDEPGELDSALDGLVARLSPDLLVTCGASSAGPADRLPGLLAQRGAALIVDGVECRPGHPQALARLTDGRLLVGLPGNPLAAVVAVVTLLAPALAGLAGRRLPTTSRATLKDALSPHPVDTRLVAVRREGSLVVPVGRDRPGMLWGAALGDALAVVPPAGRSEAGDPVELIDLPHA